MTWQIAWSASAIRDIRAIDRPVAERIYKSVGRLAAEGRGDIKRLTGMDELRLRVGDWRVRFAFDHATRTIHILRVLNRREAYR